MTERKVWCKHTPDDPCEYCLDKHAERDWVTNFAMRFHDYWLEQKRLKETVNRAVDQATRLIKEKEAWIIKREGLFDAIKHGDEAHQAWLKAKIEEHFK